LLFWVSRDNVGEARIAWLGNEDGRRGYELIIGSDPDRAPRKINRWGYITEAENVGGVDVLGFMTEVDEETLEQAKANAEGQQKGTRAFKAIQGVITPSEARTSVVGVMLSDQLTYRDIEAVKDGVAKAPPAAPRTIQVPPGADPGFLFAMASLLHESVEARRRTGSVPNGLKRTYVYGNRVYDVVTRSSRFLANAEFRGRKFQNVIESEFQARSRAGGDGSTYRIAYGTEGSLTEVPVRIVYRPKWWFEAELVLLQ
jgi:hypothetical protein